MNLKKLTQAVFEGLPPEYRWAVIRKDGAALAWVSDPMLKGGMVWATPSWTLAKIIGYDYDATNWQNSKIERLSDTCIDDMGIANAQKQSERQDVPTAADIDWSKAPEGATDYVPENNRHHACWYKDNFKQRWLASHAARGAGGWTRASGLPEIAAKPIPRPESITDVARSIEAARVAEKSERTYLHYFKDVSDVDAIDLYHVARLYDITDPALFHAFKKIACAGKRGAKDQAQDVQEAIDALKRWQELNV